MTTLLLAVIMSAWWLGCAALTLSLSALTRAIPRWVASILSAVVWVGFVGLPSYGAMLLGTAVWPLVCACMGAVGLVAIGVLASKRTNLRRACIWASVSASALATAASTSYVWNASVHRHLQDEADQQWRLVYRLAEAPRSQRDIQQWPNTNHLTTILRQIEIGLADSDHWHQTVHQAWNRLAVLDERITNSQEAEAHLLATWSAERDSLAAAFEPLLTAIAATDARRVDLRIRALAIDEPRNDASLWMTPRLIPVPVVRVWGEALIRLGRQAYHQGDIATAIHLAQQAHWLAYACRRDGIYLVDELVSCSIAGAAFDLTAECLLSAPTSIDYSLADLPPAPQAIDDRYRCIAHAEFESALRYFCETTAGRQILADPNAPRTATWSFANTTNKAWGGWLWTITANQHRRFFMALPNSTITDQGAALEEQAATTDSRLAVLLIPAIARPIRRSLAARARYDLLATMAAAITAYRDHHRWLTPDELINGEYCAAWPNDPFDGKPLRWQIQQDTNTFRLWSIGDDRVDDNGLRSPDRMSAAYLRTTHDIVLTARN